MSALIRLTVFLVAAVLAICIALVLLKLVIVLAAVAIAVVAGIFLFHFGRALYRRLTTRPAPQMISGGPTTTTF
jgi:hypothetical protein